MNYILEKNKNLSNKKSAVYTMFEEDWEEDLEEEDWEEDVEEDWEEDEW
ncbi:MULTISPECIES: hypothetical protein [Acidianus]|nr:MULTISPECIES: hypothetical protein [Acidianus]NON62184.1 hypothetical protein [Acidianus sp. RZ1]